MKLRLLGKVLLVLFCCLFVTNAEAAEKIRVGVLKFESKADGVSDRQAEIITDLFTRELAHSKTIAVYEREQLEHIGKEQKLGMSGLIDINTAVEVGRLAGLQYILLGSVTELSQKVSGGAISVIGTATREAMATINVRVIDVTTSEVVLALSETGSSSNTTSALVLGSNAAFVEGELGGVEARAIADAVSRLGHSMRAATTGETSHVIALTGDGYVLDVSAKDGALYLVYVDGKSILDMEGKPIAKEKIPLAVLKVRDAGQGHSTAVLAEGCSGKLIQRGDKVEPIARDKSKQLLERKGFAKERPSSSNTTFDQIFNEQPQAPQTGLSKPAGEPARVIDGFDPNISTDSKVIETYPLSSTERNSIGIKHRGAYNLYQKGQYKKAFEVFVTLVEEYDGNYLSAYWAGVAASKLKSHKEAAKWFDRAISINADYQPAVDARAKIKL